MCKVANVSCFHDVLLSCTEIYTHKRAFRWVKIIFLKIPVQTEMYLRNYMQGYKKLWYIWLYMVCIFMYIGKLWTWKYQGLSTSLPPLRFLWNWNHMLLFIKIKKSLAFDYLEPKQKLGTLSLKISNPFWMLSPFLLD